MKFKILILLFLLFVIALVAVPTEDNVVTVQPTVTPTVEPTRESYTGIIERIARDSFMEGCLGETTDFAECYCIYDLVRAQYTIDEIMDLDGNLPESFVYNTVLACMSDNE